MALLFRYPGFKTKAVTLSYDDGVFQDRKLIEIMSKYGIKGTFNINSGCFAKNPGERRLTSAEAYDLYYSSGNEVAVHGVQHLSLGIVDSAEAVIDVIRDREQLEDIFGRVIKGMAYANGSYNDKVVSILENCGIEYARTTVSTEKTAMPTDWLRLPATCHHNNPKLMDMAAKFLEPPKSPYFWAKQPQLFYLWGHSYEFDNNDNWGVIEEFCRFIGGRDELYYGTNGDIYDNYKAFNSLRISANGKIVHNPTAYDVYANHFGTDVLIKAGEVVKLD